jgi:hypothetical protein
MLRSSGIADEVETDEVATFWGLFCETADDVISGTDTVEATGNEGTEPCSETVGTWEWEGTE